MQTNFTWTWFDGWLSGLLPPDGRGDAERVHEERFVVSRMATSLTALNASQRAQIDIVRRDFDGVLSRVRQLVDVDLKNLEQAAETAGVPWTPGRLPRPPQ